MMTFGLITLLTAFSATHAEDGLQPLSEAQIANAFSGKMVMEDTEVRTFSGRVLVGSFCPNGRYGRPLHRIGSEGGTYTIVPGAIVIEVEVGRSTAPRPVRRIEVFGDGIGGVFKKQRQNGAMTPLLFESVANERCR